MQPHPNICACVLVLGDDVIYIYGRVTSIKLKETNKNGDSEQPTSIPEEFDLGEDDRWEPKSAKK